MYTPPAFRTDEATAWKFVCRRGFGTVVAVQNGNPIASHVPFLATADADGRRLAIHVARANPLAEVIAAAPRVLVVVSGLDSYISPDWYVSANQVPTWNYVSVHLSGSARVLPQELALDHVEALSAEFEARLAPKRPWSTQKMTPAQRDRMLAAITPMEITVETIEAQWKLGQHKSPADQDSVIRHLVEHGGRSECALAEEMAQARTLRTADSQPAGHIEPETVEK